MAAAVAVAAVISTFLVLTAAASSSLPTQRPHELRSFIPAPKSQISNACYYTVVFKTSCSSPRLTRDAISLAFGDAYRNEVYAPRLDDPASRAFERCSTDTFKLTGPCGYGVCYLYVYRQGWDGWLPESVKVYETSTGRKASFYFGVAVPNGVWYGFDRCRRIAADDGKAGEVVEAGHGDSEHKAGEVVEAGHGDSEHKAGEVVEAGHGDSELISQM